MQIRRFFYLLTPAEENPVAGGAGQAFLKRGSLLMFPHVTSPLQGPAVLLCPTHAEVTAVATAERKEVSRLFHNTCSKYNRLALINSSFQNILVRATNFRRGLKSTIEL